MLYVYHNAAGFLYGTIKYYSTVYANLNKGYIFSPVIFWLQEIIDCNTF